jgi:hippurate hydrolase
MEGIKTERYCLDKIREFRHWMHQHAELSLHEYNTHKKIKEMGLSFGVPEEAWKLCTKTGWRVEIKGKGPAKGTKRTIGCRSDHDGLPMAEQNDHLPYKSQTEAAHMCGHDGHTACLLGGMALLMDNLEMIPEDRSVVFIFQPAEEGKGGAGLMVDEGVMEGIDEVYGCHNFPTRSNDLKIMVADREMMSHFTIVEIKVIGKGGHGSSPEKCNNPIPIAARAYLSMFEQLNEYQKNCSGQLRFSLTAFEGGTTYNVIPSSVVIKGTLRDFDLKDCDAMKKIIKDTLDKVTTETNSTYELNFSSPHVGAVINTPTHAEYVRKAAREFYGEDKVGDQGLPVYASEDFSDFMVNVPGCFFFRALHHLDASVTLHSDHYDFDDNAIDDLSRFWFKLMSDRLTAD